ncbi:Galactose oxidase [Colletotrichum higginsianum IMI 349063]|uniref:Galactose oxidase n=3 Tax=Colletotrichum higginsianum TaxID=80884 RepID=A0A1B7XYR0_COLHI|nr:Galactose oxidase [Colletotrichum higginsianum IMI 349063]OBR04923.1 Galactose oxidase [Colletotrichum higginsianum IMI 349063]TIC93769.1 hypothetical protein CH35J_009340 [Colletotrichum higginsianum]
MHTLIVLASLVVSGVAQLMTPSDLATIPAPDLQTVPVGVGNQTVPVSATTSKRALRKLFARDCDTLPPGSGPVPSVDTDQGFLAYSSLSNAALQATTPPGWYQTFQNLQSATSASIYQGYKTYSNYDTARCAADCAQISGCTAFNIFFERDPSQDPGLACPNPSSTTVIKCSFWGVGIGPSTATNNGQWRKDFHIVIAGSNGYQLSAPTYSVSGYNSSFTNAATINAPTSCNSYITYKSHTNQAYDPSLCADDCAAQRQETNPFNGLRCRFFTSYLLVKNGVVQAQICALYSRTWDQSYATNTGYSSGSDVYTIQYAYSYTYSADIGNFNCPQGGSATTPSPVASVATTSITPISTSNSVTATTTVTTNKPTTLSTSSVKPTTLATSSAKPTTSAITGGANGSPLTSCPSPVSYVVGYQGGLYAVCLDTDFQIPSPQIYYGYKSNRDCVSQCEATAGCTKAVFKLSTQTCYLKGSPSVPASNWAVNQGFQTLVKVADGTPLNSCLAPTYTVTSGRTVYQVCPSSDFTNNPATDIWYGVASDAACIALCQTRNGCTKIVYNFVTKTCYNKGNPSLASTGWHVNTQFRAIYIS